MKFCQRSWYIAYQIQSKHFTNQFLSIVCIVFWSNLIRTGLVSVPILRNLGNSHQIVSVKKSSTLLSIAFHWISIKFNPYQTCINFYTLEFKKFLSNFIRRKILYISIKSFSLKIYQNWSKKTCNHFYTLEPRKFLSNIVRQDVFYISIRSLWLEIYQIWSATNFIHFYILNLKFFIKFCPSRNPIR